MQRKSPKSTQVFLYIRDQIKDGIWPLGEKIPSEASLTSDLKISRSTLREVLAQYVSLGILESKQGKGTFVIDDKVEELTGTVSENASKAPTLVRDVLEFRLLLEPQCIKMAMQRDRQTLNKLILELEKCNESMEENVGVASKFIAADISFHILIAEASGNQFFGECLHILFERTLKQHQQINSLFGFQDGLRCHKKILTYLKQGDLVRSQREMKAHIESALEALKA